MTGEGAGEQSGRRVRVDGWRLVGLVAQSVTVGATPSGTVGATPSGTLIYRLCGGTATGDVANVFNYGTVLPGAGGTLTASVTGDVTSEYANIQLISTGGTVLASAELVGKKRTLTA